MDAVTIDRLTPERRRQLTRDALVDAAGEVFARKGFHAASLEEIAETAGFTRGAIYSNFGSKEDLLLAVVDAFNQKVLGAFADDMDLGRGRTVEERSASAALLWRDLIRRDPNLTALNLEFMTYALRNPSFRRRLVELQRGHVARIAELIQREASAYGVRLKVAPDDLAEILNAATVGLTELASIDSEQAERYDRLAELLFTLIGDAIAEQDSAIAAPQRAKRKARPSA
jgi:AcrR family transcriptional regulator